MILADKILSLRKKCGWSQEELADKLEVSRQSISKWESAQSIPDINKILELARVFGVSTDYLLKDEIEQAEFTDTDLEPATRVVTLQEANEYMQFKRTEGKWIGLGVMLCILSPVTLILLSGLSEYKNFLTNAAASAIGITALLLLIAVAVGIFILIEMKGQRFEHLKKSDFNLEYGVSGLVKEKRHAQEGRYTALTIAGVALCILSPVPLIIASCIECAEITYLYFTCLLLAMASVAVYLFISSGCVRESYNQLLREGEFDREEIERNRPANHFGGFYWPIITAAYLAWSFITGDWRISWVIWPVAGLVFAGISALLWKEK